ncbi:alcohol dehydrogenase catalytic domain-containing protein [Nocardia sp. NPDC051030]|uniref:zinc-dependent alcohol dehydrogenase n=1 Tax=Nocardia sp. NPDC051030 TaxID=3155162 RepID=UPI003421BBD8
MMRAAVIDGPHSASVVSLARPERGPGEVLIAVDYVGLCGTDLELLHGTSPYIADGRVTYPHRFGHEWVGTVRSCCPSVPDLQEGEVVTGSTMIHCQSCRSCASGRRNLCTSLKEVGLYGWPGAASELLTMPRHTLVSLGRPPGGAQPAHVLIEPLVTVLEAVRHAELSPRDRVLVIGAGTIGGLAVAVLSGYPVTVDVVEPGSIAHLAPGSFRHHFPTADDATGRYDVVFECSGAPGALGAAITHLRPGGQCLLVGVSAYPEQVDPGLIALDGIRITGVRHGVDHYPQAVAMFADLAGTLGGFIDEVIPLTEVKRAFHSLAHRGSRPKVVIGLG